MTMWKQLVPAALAVLAAQSPALAEEGDIGARLYQESCSDVTEPPGRAVES